MNENLLGSEGHRTKRKKKKPYFQAIRTQDIFGISFGQRKRVEW
jgi:hypothetical protein